MFKDMQRFLLNLFSHFSFDLDLTILIFISMWRFTFFFFVCVYHDWSFLNLSFIASESGYREHWNTSLNMSKFCLLRHVAYEITEEKQHCVYFYELVWLKGSRILSETHARARTHTHTHTHTYTYTLVDSNERELSAWCHRPMHKYMFNENLIQYNTTSFD